MKRSRHQSAPCRRGRRGPVLPPGLRRNTHRQEPQARSGREADRRLRRRRPHGHGVLVPGRARRAHLRQGRFRVPVRPEVRGAAGRAADHPEEEGLADVLDDLVQQLEDPIRDPGSDEERRRRSRRAAATSSCLARGGRRTPIRRAATSRSPISGATSIAETSGGHIAIKKISGNAKVETSGGHIEADGVAGNLSPKPRAATSRSTAPTGASMRTPRAATSRFRSPRATRTAARSKAQGVASRCTVDPNVDLAIDASTSGGSVRTDIPVKIVGKVNGSSIRGTLGKGGETLYVHTSGGSVSIGASTGAI